MGAKNPGNVPIFSCRSVFFFVATYGNEVISVGGCSRLSKHCTKPASEDEMCPRWASFSNFKLGG